MVAVVRVSCPESPPEDSHEVDRGEPGTSASAKVMEAVAALDHDRKERDEPLLRHAFNALLAINNESQTPYRVELALCTPTDHPPAASVRQCKRTPDSVCRKGESPQKTVLALPQGGGFTLRGLPT
jgi:hypothetical protein